MGSPRALPRPLQLTYMCYRENPYFKGLLGDDTIAAKRNSTFDFIEAGGGRRQVNRSTSDMGEIRTRKFGNESSEPLADPTLEDSDSDVFQEPFPQSSSKTAEPTEFLFQSDLGFSCDDSFDSSPGVLEENESFQAQDGIGKSVFKKSFSVCKAGSTLARIPLPQSAASFYNGFTPFLEIVESCESIKMLNLFLKERRDAVNAGVPGKFLHAVLGQDVSDVGSVASTIMYAFYLNETFSNDQMCTVPIINMRRADLNSHAELKWLLTSCQIDETSLVFIDEVDLSYYDLFGSLKLVLLNGHKLPTKLEALKEAIVEIFNCKKGDFIYPWVQNVTVGQDCSSCTLLAEKFAMTSAEFLAGQGFSKLLLSGILMDTGNLTNPNCTSKDKYMATLLMNGAGRFGCDGLYQILRYRMYDISDLRVMDVLRKEFKKWSRVGKPDAAGSRLMLSHVGMSSIGISISQFLNHEETCTREIKVFQQMEKLRLLVIVSGYHDTEKNFKREILISAESDEVLKNLLRLFDANASELPMSVLSLLGLRDKMRAFKIDKFTSRKSIERLLEEFSTTFKG